MCKILPTFAAFVLLISVYYLKEMKELIHRFYSYSLVVFMLLTLPSTLWANSTDETIVEFVSDNAKMEDDPSKGVYNITVYSPDGAWKIQLNYHSESMFGTFSNTDFRLDSDGKYYNYARNPKNDMVFYSFTDMNVSVTDEVNLYRVKANCLANNGIRFKFEATIDAPQPKSTLTDDLGFARVTPNAFYGTYVIKAENERLKLEYGIVSDSLVGTYYRADMLKPELYDKQAGKAIEVLSASSVHTKSGDSTLFKIDLLSSDLVLYSLTMYNGPYEVQVKEERDVAILSDVVLQDLTEIYGCYQFGGQNDEYAVAIAINPGAIESGRTEWGKNDIFMPYTCILNLATQEFVDIFDVNATFGLEDNAYTLRANVTSMDGILYHVRMVMQEGATRPQVSDTVNIDFGHVAMLDYSKGVGVVGLGAVKPGEFQMRCYFSANTLEGDFSNEEFDLEMCDVMVVAGSTYVFHDAKYVTASMSREEGVTHIAIDMYGVDEVLYHATMYIDSMQCMNDMAVPIDMNEEITMLGMQVGSDGESSEYIVQFQNLEEVYDDDYNIVGDGYAMSFYFGHEGTAAIAGEYGYSAGTLADDEIHTFFEHGCEVRVAPVAGTLTIDTIQAVTLNFEDIQIHTYLYNVKFQVLGQNNVIYSAQGQNFYLCLDSEGENFVDIDESGLASLNESLAEQGFRVRKVLRDGKILVERLDQQYDLLGKRLK